MPRGNDAGDAGSNSGSNGNGNRPLHEVRHRNIRATIWLNDTAKGPMHTVTVSRSYRDGEEWKTSHSFGFDDLMTLAKALYDAHSFISAQQARERTVRQTRGRDARPR